MNAVATADVRAQAARALARIVAGRSLRAEFAAAALAIADARDRALLSALLHAGTRWWLRYAGALERLLQRALPRRDADVAALLVLGLVQVDVLALPGYAAVDASVEAARALGKGQYAGVVNAVLRRWLRERDTLCALLDADQVTRTAHPRWLLDAFAADWPRDHEAIVAANNAEPPLWLRVNRRVATRTAVAARLAAEALPTIAPDLPASALRLERSTDVTRIDGFAAGAFSVQDGAAQFAAGLLDLRDGQRVLDACAAPGGKSAHILESAAVQLTALDADAARATRIGENLARLRLRADVRSGDAARPQTWWDGTRFDRILLDAPCSASGIIRRQPDVRLHRRASDVAPLAQRQHELLDRLWPLLAPGGRLVYAVCSVFDAETAQPLARFRAGHADAILCADAPAGWRAGRAGGAHNLPGESGMDGFFYAVLEKQR